MQRLINFRAFLFLFIGAVLGTLFAYQILQKNVLALIIGSVLILGLLIFLLITGFIKKLTKFQFINKFLLCLLIGMFTFMCLSVVNYQIFNTNVKDIESAFVTARICNKNEKSGCYYLTLEEAKIEDENSQKTYNLNGKISLTIYSDDMVDNFLIGDKISFNGTLIATNLIKKGRFSSYLYKNNIKFSAFINKENFSKTYGDMHIDEKVQDKVKNLLFENMSYNNATIAFASIFGDKSMMEDGITDAFSLSGTAHLLCVSGLHVGFLVAILYLFFNLIKLKKKYVFIILSIFLLFYCYLCGFSPSVVRASIMSIVLAGSTCFGNYRYDNLNSLGFAGCIILLFKPFMIFDLGFKLSFASCFGIFLLMPVILKFFKKINFYNKFSQSLALTLSAQIGTFPIIFNNFDKLSLLSLIANIIVVPLFSIIFSLLFIFVLINLILPLGFLFKIIEVGLNLTIILTKSFGSVTTNLYYSSDSETICNIAFYLCLVFASGLINIKNKLKIVNMLICLIIICFSFLMGFIPKNYGFASIINTQNEDFTIITNSLNQKILVLTNKASTDDYSKLKKDLFNDKIFSLDVVIVSYYNANSQDFIVSVCNDYNVNKFYVSNIDESNEKILFNKFKNTQIYKTGDEYTSFSNMSFRIINSIKSVEILLLENNVEFKLFLTSSLNKSVSTYLIKYNLTGDYFKAKYVNINYIQSINGYKNILSKNVFNNNAYDIDKINDIVKLGEKIEYGV